MPIILLFQNVYNCPADYCNIIELSSLFHIISFFLKNFGEGRSHELRLLYLRLEMLDDVVGLEVLVGLEKLGIALGTKVTRRHTTKAFGPQSPQWSHQPTRTRTFGEHEYSYLPPGKNRVGIRSISPLYLL